MSRRGVAAAVGKSEATIRGWVERGLSHPGVEPWSSFADDYRRAERGLEGAAASTVAMTVQMLHELAKRALGGEPLALEQLSRQGPQMRELLNVLAARYPEDWGVSAHRRPEPEYDGNNWLEAHGLQSEQLAALFDDPPEAILQAMVSRSERVYELLAAAGCKPPGKANDETG